jgi:predicted transcriptional regulator
VSPKQTPTDPPPPLHELEAEVMDAMWRLEEANVRQVLDDLKARLDKQRAYTTVMTTMVRLYERGLLTRRPRGKGNLYEVTMSREEYLAARARAEAAALVDTYGDAVLVHFAKHVDALDPKRRQQLRRIARRD